MSAGNDLARLDGISRFLAEFGPEFEDATRNRIRAEYDFKKAEAAKLLVAVGPNASAREAWAVDQLVKEGWFDARAVAEATHRAMEARFRVLEAEKSALQTKLKVEIVELGGG